MKLSMRWMWPLCGVAALTLGAGGLVGCDDNDAEDAAEEVGESLDRAGDNIRDAADDAGDKVDDALD